VEKPPHLVVAITALIPAQDQLLLRDGIDFLYQALAEQLSGMMTHASIQLDVTSAYIRSEIHNIGYIHNEKVNDFGQWVLEINVTHHYL
jgi:GTP-binding protein HflX